MGREEMAFIYAVCVTLQTKEKKLWTDKCIFGKKKHPTCFTVLLSTMFTLCDSTKAKMVSNNARTIITVTHTKDHNDNKSTMFFFLTYTFFC